jgi:hypothetical protein
MLATFRVMGACGDGWWVSGKGRGSDSGKMHFSKDGNFGNPNGVEGIPIVPLVW